MRASGDRLDPNRLLPWLSVAAAGGWFGTIALRFPAADGDLLWQRWLGERILRDHAIPRALGAETFAASGAPWTPHEWLFSLLLAFSSDRGAPWAVPLLCSVALAGALIMVVLRCARRGVPPVRAASAVLFCSLAMLQSFGVRAQVLGWAGLTTVVWLLESDGPLAWAAIPATIVWANLHASALLAPVLAATFTLTAFARDRRWTPAVRRSAAIAAGCAAATVATPLGLDLPRYAVALSLSPIRQSISEWGPAGMGSAAFVLGALPLVLLLLAFGARASVRDRILACAFALLLFSAVRNVPVFALVAAPVALAALPRRGAAAPAAVAPGARAAAWALAAVLALMGPALALLVWRAAPARTALLPFEPARTLLRVAASPPRVFCEDFAWCSIFLSETRAARFFMDGRCDPYPVPVWREYREVLDGTRRWAAVLDARHIDAILVRRNGTLDSLLAERPHTWRAIASDERARVYVRPALVRAAARRPALAALSAR
ncbi:MAG: hypothetical protein ABR591_00850 [Candidatus Velthaea sp.]